MNNEDLPNSAGLQLVECRVIFDRVPPRASVTMSFSPLVAFRRASQYFVPVDVNGPIPGWDSIRASVSGASIYAVFTPNCAGVVTANQRYSSLDEFSKHSLLLAAGAVEAVRSDKGWEEASFPASFLRSSEG